MNCGWELNWRNDPHICWTIFLCSYLHHHRGGHGFESRWTHLKIFGCTNETISEIVQQVWGSFLQFDIKIVYVQTQISEKTCCFSRTFLLPSMSRIVLNEIHVYFNKSNELSPDLSLLATNTAWTLIVKESKTGIFKHLKNQSNINVDPEVKKTGGSRFNLSEHFAKFTKIEQTSDHLHFLAKVFPTGSSVGALIRELDFNHATYPANTDVLSQQAPTFRPRAISKEGLLACRLCAYIFDAAPRFHT